MAKTKRPYPVIPSLHFLNGLFPSPFSRSSGSELDKNELGASGRRYPIDTLSLQRDFGGRLAIMNEKEYCCCFFSFFFARTNVWSFCSNIKETSFFCMRSFFASHFVQTPTNRTKNKFKRISNAQLYMNKCKSKKKQPALARRGSGTCQKAC